jgi:glucose-1-phosphate thymidylyltransferase
MALIGFLPMAGAGRRLGTYGFAKELIPLVTRAPGADAEARPVCDFALRGVRSAGAERCIIAVSPEKAEILRQLRDGAPIGLTLAYVVQPAPLGLPDAIRAARPFFGDADVVMALPDTLLFPLDALAQVRARQVETGADLVLGVFPVAEPERLGPVEIAGDGRVLRVHDKPAHAPARNSWGAAAWSNRFTDFLTAAEERRAGSGEGILGHVFDGARAAGLDVRAVFFDGGAMVDVGTPAGYQEALAELERRGMC